MLLILVLAMIAPSVAPTSAALLELDSVSRSTPAALPPTKAEVAAETTEGSESADADENGLDRVVELGDHDLGKKRAFLLLSPGILVFQLPDQALWAWGVDGGIHRRFGELVLQTGAFFEHALTRVRGPDPTDGSEISGTAHLVRFGPELRLGGGTPHLFAYAQARVGLDLFFIRAASSAPIQREGASLSFHGSFGAGVMGLVGRRLLLGFEPGVELGTPSGIFGVSGLRARIFAGLAF
ncbi:MAG TPA: hypothetical protein ENJ18_01955 [Nannocystis exedens]|nr:hypothetical protein [Nannocystis exedens]